MNEGTFCGEGDIMFGAGELRDCISPNPIPIGIDCGGSWWPCPMSDMSIFGGFALINDISCA